ncbi:hypothetical protein COY90_03435 [Candidatus Roizmanbacteria bacterium CG_4_10_14_0_8_um_filter_39_9]|uniref:Uncharacterized protein n=1 Tax=Candidatus Roizmanbacteria bacterium CG_4_10_14_0_8_um_filter_39_9 TaxID=1974829 RepID=A0A2M7QCG7_9BACT|nr:MAG: hypothetical protein COY90_03435 [Candidatus Roizmanbacteria bacterium CG_4_10_14_0_8_um_filter_39_9]
MKCIMDQTATVANSVNMLRDRIYEDILTVMLQGLQDNKVDAPQARLIAKYALAHLGKASSTEDVMHFLDELPAKWELYKNMCVKFKYEEKAKEDVEKVKAIQNKLHAFIQ